MNKLNFVNVGVALLVFVSGIVVGNMTASSTVGTELHTVTTATKAVVTGKDSAATTTMNRTNTAGASTNGNDIAFTISIANLPESQKALIRTMGITGDSIPVTNTMFGCAEATVGSDRMMAIKNGATPTMGEGLKLVGCYKK